MSFVPQNESYRPISSRAQRPPIASYGLIGICVLVAALSKLGENRAVLEHLFITNYPAAGPDTRLPEVLAGQVWRLLTPIFIHFGAIHLIFNMMWLRDLGGMIERLENTGKLLAFTVVSGVLSNLGQLYIGGPFFGGMSGVVYGLLGYVWMRSRFSPGSGYMLQTQTVLIMLGWFIACYLNIIKGVANTAHGVGLGVGIAWGFIAAKAWQQSGARFR